VETNSSRTKLIQSHCDNIAPGANLFQVAKLKVGADSKTGGANVEISPPSSTLKPPLHWSKVI